MKFQVEKVIIGSDHGGFALKQAVIAHLKENDIQVEDVGTYSTASCDYPEYAHKVCQKVQDGTYPLGILICGTGIGMSMAANKHKGIRAAACENTFSARMTRMHNDANVLCMGARVLDDAKIAAITDTFLANEPLDEERHRRRLRMISELEDGTFDEHGYKL